MNRRAFIQSVIIGTLAAPFVTRQVKDEQGDYLRVTEHEMQRRPRVNGVLVEPITFNGHRVIWDDEHVITKQTAQIWMQTVHAR